MGITIALVVAAALVGTLPMADKVVLAVAVGGTDQARLAAAVAAVAAEELTMSFQKTRFLDTYTDTAVAVAVASVSLVLDQMALAATQVAPEVAQEVVAVLAVLLALTRLSLLEMVGHMVAAAGRVDGNGQQTLITMAAMGRVVPSASSGVLVVAIRRTPQTSN